MKKGTGELTDEEAMSSYGTPLGVKKVIPVECVSCEKHVPGCVEDTSSFAAYVEYLKCVKDAKRAN